MNRPLDGFGSSASGQYRPKAPLFFAAQSAVCQIIAAGAAAALSECTENLWLLSFAAGLAGLGISRLVKQPVPWQLFNLILTPSAIVLLTVQVPVHILSIFVVALCLLFLPTFWTRVPYYPTAPKIYGAVLSELPADKEFSFIDLGCGGGALLRYLALNRPLGRFSGTDISPLAFILSFIRCAGAGARVTLKDFWKMDLGKYDFVYAFLAPGPMPALWEKVKKEMKPGSVFITNSFQVPEEAFKEIRIDQSRQGVIYVHKMGN